MINFNEITEGFYIPDEFCIHPEQDIQSFIIGNPFKYYSTMPQSEVMIISILFHLIDFRCFQTFLHFLYMQN